MNILDIGNLSVWYEKKKLILDSMNLKIEGGSIVGILGKNGQGKTTLLNTIAGLHNNYIGNIEIYGLKDVSNIDTKRQRYYVQDIPLLFEELLAIDYLKLLHSLYKKVWNDELYMYYCRLFEFEIYSDKKIATLSLGNRQKIIIIGGLLIRAPLLILDEPLVGLDVVSVEHFYDEMKKYVDKSHAILLSSHIIDILNHICTNVIILNNKEIVKEISLTTDINLREIFNKVTEDE